LYLLLYHGRNRQQQHFFVVVSIIITFIDRIGFWLRTTGLLVFVLIIITISGISWLPNRLNCPSGLSLLAVSATSATTTHSSSASVSLNRPPKAKQTNRHSPIVLRRFFSLIRIDRISADRIAIVTLL
jgi:hypothetical protein